MTPEEQLKYEEACAKKKAIPLPLETIKKNQKIAMFIYDISYVIFIISMISNGEMSIPAIAILAASAVANAVIYAKKGMDPNGPMLMSISYLIGFIAGTLFIEAEIYPIVFVTVFALIAFQNLRLVICGATATLIINLISVVVGAIQGETPGPLVTEAIATIVFTIFSIVTAKCIYENTKGMLDVIAEDQAKAEETASQVAVIAKEIGEDFYEITGGIESITVQAGANRDALSDISGASASTNDAMVNQSNMTQTIYAIIEETQATAEKVYQDAIDVSEIVQQGSLLSEDMKNQSTVVNEGITTTNQSIENLVAEINKVTSITDAILSISSQTNLLALNASIEAARAGEAGKGFAVVADEIRQLAEQTKNSTEQITDIISKLVAHADTSVKAMNGCVEGINVQNEKIELVNQSFIESNANVENLREMVNGMITHMQEISDNVANIVDSSLEVTENSERMTELSANGVDSAAEIYDTVNQFSITIDKLNEKVNELRKSVE